MEPSQKCLLEPNVRPSYRDGRCCPMILIAILTALADELRQLVLRRHVVAVFE